MPARCEGTPVWILDYDSGIDTACEKRLFEELLEFVGCNANMVWMVTACVPAIATDVVHVEVGGFEAHALVHLLEGCPVVLFLGRIVDEHKCSFVWGGCDAGLIDHAGSRHECVFRNHVLLSEQEYAFRVRYVSAEDLPGKIVISGLDEQDEGRPGMIHDVTHFRKEAWF